MNLAALLLGLFFNWLFQYLCDELMAVFVLWFVLYYLAAV
jgi:hypothetical protein